MNRSGTYAAHRKPVLRLPHPKGLTPHAPLTSPSVQPSTAEQPSSSKPTPSVPPMNHLCKLPQETPQRSLLSVCTGLLLALPAPAFVCSVARNLRMFPFPSCHSTSQKTTMQFVARHCTTPLVSVFALLGAGIVFFQKPASADLIMCNETSEVLYGSFAYPNNPDYPNEDWITLGHFRMEPETTPKDDCQLLTDEPLQGDTYYFYAQDGQGNPTHGTNGDRDFCIDTVYGYDIRHDDSSYHSVIDRDMNNPQWDSCWNQSSNYRVVTFHRLLQKHSDDWDCVILLREGGTSVWICNNRFHWGSRGGTQ